MVNIDRKKVDEAVAEIEKSEYFQNVLSQVKKIRSMKNDSPLKNKINIWAGLLAENEFFKLKHYLKYYEKKISQDQLKNLPLEPHFKSNNLNILNSPKFDECILEYLSFREMALKFNSIKCSEYVYSNKPNKKNISKK
ncbi:MAG: hypothetical protein ACTSQO_08840 [Candidatus Helarchaeota archaeon]